MATTVAGLEVPVPSDAFDPQGDLVKLAESFRSQIIYQVPNEAGRSALVAALSWTPSGDAPLMVWRTDAPQGRKVEVTTNGSTWQPLGHADTGWLIPTVQNDWTSLNSNRQIRYRRMNGVTWLRGIATGGSATVIFNLPPGFRPDQDWRQLQQNDDSGTDVVSVVVSASNGAVAAATGKKPCLDGISFPADR